MKFRNHLILSGTSIRSALLCLDQLAKDAILFVVDDSDKLIGALTDGDVRRGLINGVSIDSPINDKIQNNPRFIRKKNLEIEKLIEYRESNFRLLPVLDIFDKVVNVINFREIRSYLPIDAVIMAGGMGKRLLPLTEETPKPLLKVGDKPIIEHNIDRLIHFGIDDFWISVNYLGEKITNYLGNGSKKNVKFNYVWENQPLGTIGSISQIDHFHHDYILVTNSDILTNLDYEKFFLDFIKEDADLSVLTIPYNVNVPYAVLENDNRIITSFKEKPSYTYYSNGGVYLFKKNALNLIPKNSHYNATDLMDKLIQSNKRVISFPMMGYWLDVGNMEDYKKAQIDIQQIDF
jgi:dTDP-glucose pyrophosphorylase